VTEHRRYTDLDPCMEYQGTINAKGYGQLRWRGKLWLAHRLVAHLTLGPAGPGQMVRHKCDNRRCINPGHLEYGTNRDNMLDRRERHRFKKLTRDDAEAIKAQIPHRTAAAIGKDFGISDTMVYYIRDGKQWA
jgi:hypothetical protein